MCHLHLLSFAPTPQDRAAVLIGIIERKGLGWEDIAMKRSSNGFNVGLCICGKYCTSKPGLTLHQFTCTAALAAKQCGQPTTRPLNTQTREDYIPEVEAFYKLTEAACRDAQKAIIMRNKSAGKRSRRSLLELRTAILLLRKKILFSMKRPSDPVN
jgi:hypothetical protein